MDKPVPISHRLASPHPRRRQPLIVLTLGVFSLFLFSCSTPPSKKASTPTISEAPAFSIETAATPTAAKPIRALEAEARQALQSEDYPTYVEIAQILWQSTQDPEDHAAISYQLWRAFQGLTSEQLIALKNIANETENDMLSDWTNLALSWQQNQGIHRAQAAQDEIAFSDNPVYFDYLKTLISAEVMRPPYLHKIAVFLPLSGKYHQVSEQIRNGMIKHLFAQQSDWELKFYDTFENRDIQALYQQAMDEGADRIIGPLTKHNIQQLQTINTTRLLTLNRIETPTVFAQYGYPPLSEITQIEGVLCYQNYRHIGILSSQANGDLRLAQTIAYQWRQIPFHHAAFNSYPTQHPNLRKALGGLINETQSQARKANLQWLFKEKLTFRPRLRQDLEAIVIMGNRRQTAVFKPQFKFFDLKLPIYGTSKLTPEKLHNSSDIKDLSHVIFPTMPVVLQPKKAEVETPFEAFGWDSLTILARQHLYAPQLCDHAGLTGAFEKTTENFIDRWLTWAIYDYKGHPQPWEPKPPKPRAMIDLPQPPAEESAANAASETLSEQIQHEIENSQDNPE